MIESDDAPPSDLWRWLRIFGFGLATIFLVGIVAGFVSVHVEKGGPFGLVGGAVLAGLVLAAVGCGWMLARAVRRPAGEEALTPRERLNRNILIGCGLIGGAMAAVVMFGSDGGLEESNIFSNAPLPAWVAIVLVLVTGLLVPALSIYWHRSAVDEQEADAYKTGALFGMYVFMIGAPTWWFAWRGGFAPEPNGVAIYLATVFTVGAIWMWKKYR